MRKLLRYFFIAILAYPLHSAWADDLVSVAHWTFGTESSDGFKMHGAVLRDQAGPRPPRYPDFSPTNTALSLGDAGGYIAVPDPGTDSAFDFQNGDEISLEAWIKPDQSLQGAPVYIVGKGRTENPKFAKDNQNWALRLQKVKDQFHIGFLFATQPGSKAPHWHRWTSTQSFPNHSAWHHVAVSYRFGQPDSMRGWIDGKPTEGVWDMGGPTSDAPIVDDDEVWIGSAKKGNRFVGAIDNVAIYRGMFSDVWMAAHVSIVGEVESPPKLASATMPELGELPAGKVLITMAEGLPSADRWLMEDETWPSSRQQWQSAEFLLDQLPLRYDDWGIRDAWQAPVLLRMAADVQLPPGKHRVLLRARGLGRLWLDGQVIAETTPIATKAPDGDQPVTPLAEPPVSGARPHGYRQQEVFADIDIKDRVAAENGTQRLILELVVGGKDQRTETGEVCVAFHPAGQQPYAVITPWGATPLSLTDEAVIPVLARQHELIDTMDESTRHQAAATQDAYWDARHEWASQWAAGHRPVTGTPTGTPAGTPTDTLPSGSQGLHPVDALIADKIARAMEASAGSDSPTTQYFHQQVLPILRDQCFRCHGEKSQGGLKLNSREAILLAGESEQPAVVPGDPAASELIVQIRSGAMPPTDSGLSADQVAILESWIRNGAVWPAPPVDQEQVAMPALVGDEVFLRRIYLDTVGVPPAVSELQQFLQDNQPDKRGRWIDRLLDDRRLADNWISLWQDLLAENPTLINQSMGSTGPFRWFLYESLLDHKPLDRMVTELIMMRGSPDTGGSAGFSQSGESDAPFAEKGHILASAFLGVELQCARCHDSPYHSTTQRDLYALAAMLERKPVKVPATSRVPDAFFEKKGRESLIRVTMAPDEAVPPVWTLAAAVGVEDHSWLDEHLSDPSDSRQRLALLITAPQNQRFGQVMVNRVWKRLVGTGLVEPVDDWEGQMASHPELLDWLVHELITHRYDLRVVMRHIFNSQLYQREAVGNNQVEPTQRYFAAPDRRRMSAEQVVDALHATTGSKMDVEELTFVYDGQRPIGKRQTLGKPQRAWMFASLNNERDRPSLSLPRAQVVVDVLQAFGWNGSRQKPISVRETDPNVLQPGILSNGVLTLALSRASRGSQLSQCAIAAASAESLVDEWFMRILTRHPTAEERRECVETLSEGFEARLLPADQIEYQPLPQPLPLVTWFNHLQSETTTIQQEIERRVATGPAVDPRLDPHWREIYEDFIWSLINRREFVWIP
jgi:hypothetical protein